MIKKGEKMQIPKINHSNCSKNSFDSTSFNGTSIVKKSLFEKDSILFDKFINATVQYGVGYDPASKAHIIKVNSQNDIEVFAKLKNLGLKIKAVIAE